jgi:hypothetical protein
MVRSKEMPERELADEYETLNVPVIPCRKRIDNRSRRLGAPAFEIGWEGVKIVPGEDGGYKAKVDKNFTLTILEDGYCEIPSTPKNREKLELLLKEVTHYKVKMKEVIQTDERNVDRKVMVPDLDERGKAQYTDLVDRVDPPAFVKLKSRRQFDAQTDSRVDLVRPWLKPFVTVPSAVMLPHPAEE